MPVETRACVTLQEMDSPQVIGTFGSPLHGEEIPRAGEMVQIGSLMGRVQDVVWLYSEGNLWRVDVWLPTQRAHVNDETVLTSLREDGFHPLDEDGNPLEWAEPAATADA